MRLGENSVALDRRQPVDAELSRYQRELQEMSALLVEAQERERMRVAGDLHDGLGQSLSFVKLALAQLSMNLKSDADDSASQLIGMITNHVQEVIGEVRRIALGLRPSVLDDLGLVVALSALCRDFQAMHGGIEVRLQLAVDESQVADEHKIVIYRIVQEVIHNAAKHSRASTIAIHLRRVEGQIELTVNDNGCGFDDEALATGAGRVGGLGLGSIRARVLAVGGTYKLCTGIGEGVRMVTRLPMVVQPSQPMATAEMQPQLGWH